MSPDRPGAPPEPSPEGWDPGSRFRPAPTVLFRELGGEAVLLEPQAGLYFGLDEIGTRIWSLLEGGASLGEVQAELMDHYAVSRETLRADLLALVRDLVERRLLEPSPPSP